jgi:hypothetical protein
MTWNEDVARVLVADRLRTLRATYQPHPRPAALRRFRRRWRPSGRIHLGATQRKAGREHG